MDRYTDSAQLRHLRKLKDRGWKQVAARVPYDEYAAIRLVLDESDETIRSILARGVKSYRATKAKQ